MTGFQVGLQSWRILGSQGRVTGRQVLRLLKYRDFKCIMVQYNTVFKGFSVTGFKDFRVLRLYGYRVHAEFWKVIITFEKTSYFLFSMFLSTKKVIFERKIKIFYASLFSKNDFSSFSWNFHSFFDNFSQFSGSSSYGNPILSLDLIYLYI